MFFGKLAIACSTGCQLGDKHNKVTSDNNNSDNTDKQAHISLQISKFATQRPPSDWLGGFCVDHCDDVGDHDNVDDDHAEPFAFSVRVWLLADWVTLK